MEDWFEISPMAAAVAGASAPEGAAKITINGDIGDHWWDGGDVTSDRFMNAVNALGDVSEIEIDMNSPGGSVSGGLTIANYLRNHKARVVVNVLGQASSIASVIASAADEVRMGIGAFMMVHNPWSVMAGNAEQFRAMARDLDTLSEGMLDAYSAKIGEERRDEMASLVNGTDGDGTILSAEMAVEIGLADSMLETRAAASVSDITRAMAKARAEGQAILEPETPAAPSAVAAIAQGLGIEESEVEADLDAAALQIVALRESSEATAESLQLTPELLQASHPQVFEAVRSSVDIEGPVQAGVSDERQRVVSIVKACATTGSFKSLEKLITDDWEADKASEYVLAEASTAEHIDPTHSPEGGQTAGIDTTSIYARRNRKTTT
ncbi:MAG: head maturation protease, ClpP-related [Pseudomonadota bacterium]